MSKPARRSVSKKTVDTFIGAVTVEVFKDGSVYLGIHRQDGGHSASIGLTAAEWSELAQVVPEVVPVVTTDDEGKPAVLTLPAEEWKALGQIAVEV